MSKQKGFSLIEVLVVLGIIVTVGVSIMIRPKNPQKDYNRFFRRFSLMSKKIRNQALIENSTYRMVFLLEDEGVPQIWVEKTSKSILLGSEKESREKFKQLLKKIKEDKHSDSARKDSKKQTKKKQDAEGFRKSSRFSFEKLKMPRGLKIRQIEISGLDYVITSGLSAFHYFPQGLVEACSIQFVDHSEKYKVTLVTDSISGELFVAPGHKSLRELQER